MITARVAVMTAVCTIEYESAAATCRAACRGQWTRSKGWRNANAMMLGASNAGMYQYTRLSASSRVSAYTSGCGCDASLTSQYAWNVDETPNAVAITNSIGVGMNLRPSTEITIGGMGRTGQDSRAVRHRRTCRS